MIRKRDTVVLYTTGVCNLNCTYCYIDKNEALVKIDDMLDESFKGDYYAGFIKEMFPDPKQLVKLETWGGEPFLRMDRLHHTLRKIIPVYPNLATLFSSSNLAFDGWCGQFFDLMDVLGGFTDRRFNYSLQVSLDGPEGFTDLTRGKGTTKKVIDTFREMLSEAGNRLPSNVNLCIHFKPTLNLTTIRMLDSREAVIDYYRLFDGLTHEVRMLGFSNINIDPNIPNMACPCPAAKEDGEFFARLCKTTRGIEQDNLFRYYQVITPFASGARGGVPYTLRHPQYTCGSGYTVLGLLPDGMISSCHNGFVDVAGDYKDMCTANKGSTTIDPKLFLSTHEHRMMFHKDEYHKYENQMACFNCQGTSARVATIANQIMLLAHAGQVLPMYKDHETAIKAAIFYQSHTAYCVRDNHSTTGSLTTVHNGMLKFLFNGAHQLLEREGDVQWLNQDT